MLHTLINVIEIIQHIGYYLLVISYKTGQIIVTGLLTLMNWFEKLFQTIYTLLIVINEDLLVFLYDLLNRLHLLVSGVTNCFESIFEIFSNGFQCFKLISNFGLNIFNIFTNFILKLFTLFGNMINLIKHLVVLFGSGVWFAVTLVPVFIVYLVMLMVYCVGRAIDEIVASLRLIRTCIVDAVTFIIDVPIEAIAGLIICACLTYTLIKFHLTLYGNALRAIRSIRSVSTRQLLRMRRNVPQRQPAATFRTQNNYESSSSSSSESSDTDMELLEAPDDVVMCSTETGWRTKLERNRQLLEEETRLCVICLERNKCILAMPCRHMCTCRECSDRLEHYQHTCPICRSFINYTIHVF